MFNNKIRITKKVGRGIKLKILEDSFILDGCVFTAEDDFVSNLLDSKLNACFFQVPHEKEGLKETVRSIGRIYNLVDNCKQKLRIARSFKDLLKSLNDDYISLILFFQHPYSIGNSLEQLRAIYELGVRVIQLTYNKANYIGTGCTETIDRGLTDFGKQIIHEMNRLGIVVDLSHCSKQTACDALRESSMPVIYSHADVKNISNNPRNRTDEELKLLSKNGGVIGISPWGPLCWKKNKDEQPSLEDYLNHVDYVVNLIGINYVGFSSDINIDGGADNKGVREQFMRYPSVVADYDKHVGYVDVEPGVRYVKNFKGIFEIANLVNALLKKGYSDSDISKFLGGNFLRVIKNIWK